MESLFCPLRKNAVNIGKNPAVISGKNLLTYQELDFAVEVSVRSFLCLGIKKGDRICLASCANIEYLIVLFALWRIGAITCLLNEHLPQSVINEQCKQVRAKFVLSGSPKILSCKYIRVKKINIFSVADFYRPGYLVMSFLGKRGSRTIDSDSRFKHSTAYGGAGGMTRIYYQNNKERIVYPQSQAATVIFSSGSSGNYKAVQQSFGSHYYNAKGSNENIPVLPSDRWLISLPLYHVSGLSIIFRCMLSGGAVVIPYKNNDIIGSIDRFKVTHISLVAAQVYRLLSDEKALQSLKKLKCILLGGSAIPENILKNAVKSDISVYVSYGLTEMSSQVATTGRLEENSCFLKTKVLRYRKVRIAKDGEILLSGKTLFQGYVNKGKLVKSVDAQGWFHSRDLGSLEKGRYLFVQGRKDNMFISGGENIFPEEIEKLLCKFESIEQAVVVPFFSQVYGARPVVFLKLKKHKRLILSAVLEYLKQYLPKFKIPDEFYAWPEKGISKGIKLQRKDFLRLVQEGKTVSLSFQ